MKKKELVFVAAPAMGHLVPSIEMAKLLIDRHEQLSITFLMMSVPFDIKLSNYTKSLAATSTSRIRFIELVPEESSLVFSSTFLFEFIDSHMPQVRNILAQISNSGSNELAGVIIDMLCTSMIDVANEFGVPTYVFYICNAAYLGLVLHLLSLRDDFGEDVTNYKDSDIELSVPTYANPVPAKVLPDLIFDKEGGCKGFLDQAKRFKETKGIIINTFQEIESDALQALSENKNIPQIYTAGPLLNLKGVNVQNQKAEMIMKWLDLQPKSSVVFICSGSGGFFGRDQVQEIALALERSGHRFLWALMRPPALAEDKTDLSGEYENLENVFPEGFLRRTEGVGKIIGWAPQVKVLSHPAVGGFVTHSGWNSALESLWFGVPMATWPLYAEQQVNAFRMVKDLKMAVEIKMDYRQGFLHTGSDIVSANVIEDGIRRLMDPGNEIRNKVKEMKEKSRLALKEGGSSSASLRSLIDELINGIP